MAYFTKITCPKSRDRRYGRASALHMDGNCRLVSSAIIRLFYSCSCLRMPGCGRSAFFNASSQARRLAFLPKKPPRSDFSEAQVMASYLESHGIASHRIFLENRSHNTQENILFSTQLAQSNGFPPSFIVVTDSFHQLRSALYLRKYGFTPYSVPSQTPWGLLPGYWVREWLAILETLFLS